MPTTEEEVVMSMPTIPPFELDQYRLLHLECTRSITCVDVKSDAAFLQTDALEEYLLRRWDLDARQISDIILRILLHSETCATDEAPPAKFVLHGRGYTLMVELRTWLLPNKYEFRQEIIHLPNAPHPDLLDPTKSSTDGKREAGTGEREVWTEAVVAWPYKFRVTYSPEEVSDV